MLSHHDRDALEQIAQQLEASDPALAETLRAGKMPGRPRTATVLLVILGVAGSFVLILGLAAASPGIALSGVVALISAAFACAVVKLGNDG
jgi:hypothetical protein